MDKKQDSSAASLPYQFLTRNQNILGKPNGLLRFCRIDFIPKSASVSSFYAILTQYDGIFRESGKVRSTLPNKIDQQFNIRILERESRR